MIVLSVDQASNVAGCSLWNAKHNELLAVCDLKASNPGDKFSRRVQEMVPQLTTFLTGKPKVDKVVFEGVKARLVTVTVGAFLTCPLLDVKLNESTSFVASSTWKAWAQRRGASSPFRLIKGCFSLGETGFDLAKYGVASDDIADSIMQYYAWREKHGWI